MATVLAILNVLKNFGPLGLMILLSGGMLFVIYHLVAEKGKVNQVAATQETIASNHLTHIEADVKDMKTILGQVRDGITTLIERTR